MIRYVVKDEVTGKFFSDYSPRWGDVESAKLYQHSGFAALRAKRGFWRDQKRNPCGVYEVEVMPTDRRVSV